MFGSIEENKSHSKLKSEENPGLGEAGTADFMKTTTMFIIIFIYNEGEMKKIYSILQILLSDF